MKKVILFALSSAILSFAACEKKIEPSSIVMDNTAAVAWIKSYNEMTQLSASELQLMPPSIVDLVNTTPGATIIKATRLSNKVVNKDNKLNNMVLVTGINVSKLPLTDQPTHHASLVTKTSGLSDMEATSGTTPGISNRIVFPPSLHPRAIYIAD